MRGKMLSAFAPTALIFVMVFCFSAGGETHGKSAKVDGREASFRAGLEADGFIVNDGYTYPVDPIADLLDSGLGDSANANNAGQPYKIFMIPPHPTEMFMPADPAELALSIFRIRPDEAIVYLGPTPPMSDYFSFTPYLWVRREGRNVEKGDLIFAAVSDPLNSALIKTGGNGNPFHKQTVIIFTADEGIYERVAALAQTAGYRESMINCYILPSELLHLGVLSEYPHSDSLALLIRAANFARPQRHLGGFQL